MNRPAIARKQFHKALCDCLIKAPETEFKALKQALEDYKQERTYPRTGESGPSWYFSLPVASVENVIALRDKGKEQAV